MLRRALSVAGLFVNVVTALCGVVAALYVVPGSSRTNAQTGGARRPMTFVDLLNVPRVGDPQLSPDGGAITFLVSVADWPNNRRTVQLWRINVDGSGSRQLSDNAQAARWSPDGTTIAYLSGGRLFVMNADGSAPRQISKRTGVSDITWHPDGGSVYFLAFDPPTAAEQDRQRMRGDIRVLDEVRRRHLWRMRIADGDETRITTGSDYIFTYDIAVTGERIIVSRRPSNLPVDTNRIELWSIAADGTAPVQLTSNSVPEEDGRLAPDGSQVLFLSRANHRLEPYYNNNLFLVSPAGGQPRAVLPDFPHEVHRAGWARDSKSIWMIVNTGVRMELFQLEVATRTLKQITNGDHALVPASWNAVGKRHVFMVDEPTRIGDVWTWTEGSPAPTRVTAVYDFLDRDFALPKQEQVEWKGIDGVRVEGVLTYPINYKPGTRYPLVVQLHGGPEASDRFGWGSIFFNYQPAWAGRGYAILRPNYRGSSGYGNVFYREPIGGYFKNSHHDVLAGIDRVIAMGVADPNQLAVMGWSAGGHLVNKLITSTTRFKAASVGAGVANWISLYGASDTRADRDLWLGGSLWQKNAPIQTYWEQSPLKYVTSVRTPTMFLSGEYDPRIPMTQAVEMSRALRAQGVPTEVHIAPGEGHDWIQPAHQLYKMNVETEWFEKYVRHLPYTPEPIPPSKNP